MTQAVPTVIANGLEIQYVTIVDGSGNAIATVASLGQKTMAASSPVVIASDQSAIAVTPAGNVAHDGVDSGNPIKTGGKASLTAPAAVSTGDRADHWTGLSGQQIVGGIGVTGADAGSNTLVQLPNSNTGSSSLDVVIRHFNGASWDRVRTPIVFKVVALSAATAEATIWTPTSTKKFRLMGFLLTCGAASTLTFKDGTGLTTIFAARGTTDVPIATPPMGNGILSGAADRVLTVTRGTSCTLDGVVWGTEE